MVLELNINMQQWTMMAKLYGKNNYIDKMNFASQQFIRKLQLLLGYNSQPSRKPAATQFAAVSC